MLPLFPSNTFRKLFQIGILKAFSGWQKDEANEKSKKLMNFIILNFWNKMSHNRCQSIILTFWTLSQFETAWSTVSHDDMFKKSFLNVQNMFLINSKCVSFSKTWPWVGTSNRYFHVNQIVQSNSHQSIVRGLSV